jgi:hypothetical protein
MQRILAIDLPFGEGFAQVTGFYTPGRAGTMYNRNGDPGDPPEPEEFDVESIVVGGVDITEELVGVCKETAFCKCGYDYPNFVDWWLEKNWDRVVAQCEGDYCD